jgi:hypothetical protein
LKQGGKLDPDPAPSRRLTELISKALLDDELRDRLFADPGSLAREFDLPSAEAQAIKLLDRRAFEQMVARLRWG